MGSGKSKLKPEQMRYTPFYFAMTVEELKKFGSGEWRVQDFNADEHVVSAGDPFTAFFIIGQGTRACPDPFVGNLIAPGK